MIRRPHAAAVRPLSRGGISTLLVSLLSRINGWVWHNVGGWTRAARAALTRLLSPRAAASSDEFKFEAIEPRVLLSADLGAGLGSRAGAVDDHTGINALVMADSLNSAGASPSVILPANIERLESPLRFGELDQFGGSMAQAARPSPLYLVNGVTSNVSAPQTTWIIGETAGGYVPSVSTTDLDGSTVVWTIGGKGTVSIVLSGAGYSVAISGSDSATQIGVAATGGDGRALLTSVTASAALKSFGGITADLAGALNVAGPVRTLVLGNLTDASITTGGTGLMDLTASVLTGTVLLTTQVLDVVKVGAWTSNAVNRARVEAAAINTLTAERDFSSDIVLSGLGAGALLISNFKAGGTVGASQWNINGRVGNIAFGSSAALWRANIKGAVSQLAVSGDLAGQLAVASLQVLQVSGSVRNFTLLVGADLGSDGVLGGTGAAGDKFSAGTLARVRISGSMIDSTFQIANNPVNGVFDDGDDAMLGTASNRLQELFIGGALGSGSRITAPGYPATVTIGGAVVNPLSLAQLGTASRDLLAPTVTARLANDTGTSSTDGITADASISGSASDLKGATVLKAALDPDGAALPGRDVSISLKADGSFLISAAEVAALAPAGLADGSHVLRLAALDAAGNQSTPVDVRFMLDRSAPALTAFDLDPASDSDAKGDHITNAEQVTLRGTSEPGARVTLVNTGASALAGSDGSFAFADLALALGANNFTVALADAAGNSVQQSLTITRVARDSVAPAVSAALSSDTGISATDGITSDPSMRGSAIDNVRATALFVSLDTPASQTPAIDLSALLQADGSFLISTAQLAALAPAGLADGPHLLRLVARDAAGNQSAPLEVAFTLDRSAPVLASFDLDPAFDSDVAGDHITSAAAVTVRGSAEAGARVTLLATGASTVAANDGSFRFDGVALSLGANVLTVSLADAAGNSMQGSLNITRVALTGDSVAPTLRATLNNDTGPSASDAITSDPAIRGSALDNVGAVTLYASLDPATGQGATTNVSAVLQADGSFLISAAQLASLAGGALSQGSHVLRLRAGDAAGNLSDAVDVAFTFDAAAPQIASFAFAAADASNAAGDQTGAARAQIKGVAEAGAVITLASQGLRTVAGAGGVFVLAGVELAEGVNSLTLTATDAAGNSSSLARTLTRVVQQRQDGVLAWNAIALAAIQRDVSDPTVATRVLAIQSIAVFDTLAAIENTPAFLVQRSVSGPVSADAAVAQAAYRVLYQLYPAQRAALDGALASSLAAVTDGAAKLAGIALGDSIASAVLAIRAGDGYLDFATDDGSTDVGKWRPVGPLYMVAQSPQWADVTPFVLDSGDQFRAPPPPALDSADYAAALEMTRTLGAASGSTRTADQTEQAHFWTDGGGSVTPPGHWNQIAAQVAAAQGNSMSANALLMAQLNLALADAAIACWDVKYAYDAWRPVTAIQNADQDGNAATTVDANWQPLLITPPHPEYVSGHSTFSAAAADILTSAFGSNVHFSTTSSTLPGVTRSFTSFEQAAAEAGESRIYGGIHFEFSNQAGQALGKQVGDAVLARFALTDDTRAPVVVIGDVAAVTKANLQIAGQVLDNLSGVVSLRLRIDNGALQDVAFDAEGKFSVTTALALDGSADGAHTLALLARDAAGNLSAAYTRTFTLDTRAPVVTLPGLPNGAVLDANTHLLGSADPTGSALAALSYSIDGGALKTLAFDAASGAFDQALPIGNLGFGEHTLTLRAQDAAGNITLSNRTVNVAALAAFNITGVTPAANSNDVGTTYRPQIYFSRAVNAATLTAQTLYATGPDGTRLDTTIVPALDGSFAWLFFKDPMPGGSTITLHVNGSAIRAAQDGSFLDADGDGASGGQLSWSFTTVSTASVAGTRLTGRVVDPGPDLQPMTFDDIRRGSDGIIHTADDVFLLPIAHARVFIVGRPDLSTFTDANGNFSFDNVPVGDVKVGIDGRTASNPPTGIFFPEMVMDVQLRPGITNTLMGSMGSREAQQDNADRSEVYLPRVQSSAMQDVSDTAPTTITVNAASAPGLTEEQRSALTLTVAPGSSVGFDGKVLQDVKIGINTVPPALVKDMLPAGVLQHTFDITIQAPGVDTFAQPLQITFPNVFDAAPGTKLNILSFDHTTGMLVISGTATVSADGKTVVSDEGSGVLAPGWHGMVPPGTNADGSPAQPCLTDIQRSVAAMAGVGKLGAGSIALLSEGASVVDTISDLRDLGGLSKLPSLGKAFGHFFAGVNIATNAIEVLQELQNKNTDWANVLFLTSKTALTVAGVIVTATGVTLSAPVAIAAGVASLALSAKDIYEAIAETLPKASSLLDKASTLPPCNGTQADLDKNIAGARDAIKKTTDTAKHQADELKKQSDALDEYGKAIDALPKGNSADPADRITDEDIQRIIDALETLRNIYDANIGDIDPFFPDGITPDDNDPAPTVIDYINNVVDHYHVAPSAGGNAGGIPVGPAVPDKPGACGIDWRIEGAALSLSGKSMDGNISVVLPPNQSVVVTVYDASKGLYGEKVIRTAASGTPTHIGNISLISVAGFTDSDGDGLVDVAEKVIGTSIAKADTDNDGLTDSFEAANCLDPLSGLVQKSGVIGSLALAGTAAAIAVVAAPADASALSAYVVTSEGVLNIVDVSQAQSPLLLSRLALAGPANAVAVDAGRGIAAVAVGDAGVQFIDIQNPSAPRVTQTVGFNSAVSHVQIRDGIAYVTTGTNLAAVDINTGEIRATIDLGLIGGNTLTDLAIDGGFIYTMDAGRMLRSVQISGDLLTAKGAIELATGAGKLFVGGGIAYVGGQSGFTQGYSTVDVANAADLRLLSNPDSTSIANGSIAANGSGLAISAGALPGVGNVVHVINVADPTRTDRFVTQFLLPGLPMDLALANGLAFVADAASGLQIINYLGFDTQGKAPAVSFTIDATDADPATPGIQVLEGRTVSIKPVASDDLQVRNLQLLVNGQPYSNDPSYPWNLVAQIPSIAAGGNTMTLQVRADDTGGNSTRSAPMVLNVVADTFAPVLASSSLANGDRRFFVRSIELAFDEPIDAARLNSTGATLLRAGADGQFGTSDDTVIDLHFDTRNNGQSLSIISETYLSPGDYRLTVSPSIIADRAGNALAAPIVRTFTVRPASDIRAGSGVAAIATAPSANAGQQIGIAVPFDPATARLQVRTADANGTFTNQIVNVTRVNTVTGTAYFNLPANVVTGDAVVYSLVGSVRTDFADGTFPLQIIPVVTSIDVQSVSADGSSAVVVLKGNGFVEGQNSEYRFGSGAVVVSDPGSASGPDVQQVYDPVLAQYVNGQVVLTVPLSNGVFGPISVKTAGGTSANFSAGLTGIQAVALSGTPADASKASANPGQAVTLTGNGLSTASDILLRYTDYSGAPAMVRVSPIAANAEGTQATLILPFEANGVFSLQMFGSSTQPLLQIVPTVTRFASNGNQLFGSGFVEGGSRYDIGSASIVDTDISTGVDVSYYYDPVRGAYFYGGQASLAAALPTHYGLGPIKVTTAGGSSAPLQLNAIRPGSNSAAIGALGDVAVDPASGDLWTIDQDNPGHLTRIDPTSGLVLQTIALTPAGGNQYTANFAGLQILGQAANIGGVSVPAGSLLVFEGYAYNANNGVAAIDSHSGAVLAKVSFPVNYYGTAGLYDPASGHLFVLSQQFNRMIELNATTGAEIGQFAVPLGLSNYSGIAIDPTDGNFWIGSYQAIGQLVKISRTGIELRRVDVASQGVDGNQISGLAFAADGSLRVSTTDGLIYKVGIGADIGANPGVAAPTLTGLAGAALLGSAAQAGVASANVGQVIELTGSNFSDATQVIFNVRDNAGKTSTVAVRPQLIDSSGTRLQVIVPDLATSGDIRVANVGTRDLGFTSYNDGVYRGQSFNFTASGATAALRFADGGIKTIDTQSWGLDNVVVRQGASVVFSDDFEGAATGNWSDATVNRGSNLSAFSGRFNNASQTLNLSGLTAGQSYTVGFDLLALDQWEGSGGNPDQISVSVDGALAWSNTISNSLLKPQSINATAGLRLQIVPTLTGFTGRPGDDSIFTLQGSGFMEGATTITVGGVAIADASNISYPFDVSGQRNDTINATAPRTLDGPIRVSTEGGFAQLASGVFAGQPLVEFTALSAAPASGIAADPSRPAANTGDSIVISGQGFTSTTLVQFQGIDASGATGTLTVTGSVSNNGRSLTVRVPALARTGAVTVIGSGNNINLQVVPTLRAVSGVVLAGNELLIEGTGLTADDLIVQIDGRGVGNFSVTTTVAGSGSGRDQQLMRVTVPAGVSAGTVTVSTAGGSATVRSTSLSLTANPDQAVADSGNVLSGALNPALGVNQSVKLNGAISDGFDVDLYRIDLAANEQLSAFLTANNYVHLRLFNSAGIAVASGYREPGNTATLTLTAPVAGSYYVGVSSYSNTSYNPNIPGTPVNGGYAGSYSLNLARVAASSHRISSISATASSGTPARAVLPSSNVLQTITINGTGLLPSDQVVFTLLDDSGQIYDGNVTPTSVASDGSSLTVVVPLGAATGMVRLARDTGGMMLQIVPTLSDIAANPGSVFNGGNVSLSGTGFTEGSTAVLFGSARVDDVSRYYGTDISSTGRQLTLTVPENLPSGPIRVSTVGGTSAPFGLIVSGLAAVATTGTATSPDQASAVPGQMVRITGAGLDASTDVAFPTIDSNGVIGEIIVRATFLNNSGTQMDVRVPSSAISGKVRVIGDIGGTLLPLQIVPVVTGVEVQSVSADGSSAVVILRGSGFIEGNNSEYRFGSDGSGQRIVDAGATLGADVQQVYDPILAQYVNGQVALTVPLSNGVFGPISVKTAGGTSANFSAGLTGIQAVALSGTPADASKASANPGQAVTLTGNGLSTASDILLRYTDYSGAPAMVRVSPIAANAEGTQATLILPFEANGVFSLQMFGSSTQPLLQIVPTVTRFASNGNQLFGSGFVEGGSRYDIGSASIVDTDISTGVDVSYYYDPVRGAYFYGGQASLAAALPTHYGLGPIKVTTAGGSSAPLQLNAIRPGSNSAAIGALGDVAVDPASGDLWTIDQDNPGHLTRIDPTSGLVLQTIALTPAGGNQYTANFAGLQILGQAANIGGVSVPAGSLLVFEGYAYNANNGVAAIDSHSGAVLAKVSFPVNYYGTAGLYDPASGHLFVLSQQFNRMIELNATTGAEIGQFAVPLGLSNYSGIAIDPTDGNFWIGSYQAIGQLVKISRTGIELRRVDVASQGVDGNQISGLAFAADGSLRVSTTDGLIYKVGIGADIGANPGVAAPTLTGLAGAALLGSAAQAGVASANVGQVIELTGSNFSDATQVIFNVRDNAGKTSTVAVRPQLIDSSGTRLQVIVPDLATSGDIRVANVGTRDLGFTSYNDGVYRGQSFTFTASGATAALRFADGGIKTIDTQSWGLDNVVVRQGASVVFSDDFEGAATGNWSDATVNRGSNLSAFSGRFNNASQTLNLSGLTAGQTYTVGFDLLALDQWEGSGGNPDQVSVSVDGALAWSNTISNSLLKPQSINATAGLRLQIVPTLTGFTGRPGDDSIFTLQGSGFMEGATTITVGGVPIADASNISYPFDVSGQRNDNINATAPRTLDGPVRISTEGGYAELKSLLPAIVPLSQFDGITARSADGTPRDNAVASANSGQTITLNGQGFTSATLVQFKAVDDTGTAGTVTRTGSAASDGRTLTIRVPAQAVSGAVSVIGSGASAMLQVVPTLRGLGGTLTEGATIMLEVSGLPRDDLAVDIDGRSATIVDLRGTVENTSGLERNQQLLRVIVPAGISAGEITVRSGGGSASMHLATSQASLPDQSLADAGNVLGTATTLTVGLDQSLRVNASIAPDGLDVDLYRIDLIAGNQLTAAMSSSANVYLRLFDSNGSAIAGGYRSSTDTTPLSLVAAASGAYYVGVSAYFNTAYDPKVAGSSSNGSYTGAYALNVTRTPVAGSHLSAITATAGSGTPAQAGTGSANTLQTITLAGVGLLASDRVVFTAQDDSGALYDIIATPVSVAANGSSLTVTVPQAATTGTVRLSRDSVGLILQIVPTVSDVQANLNGTFDGGSLQVKGSGFTEGNSSLLMNNRRIDDIGRNYGLDVTSSGTVINMTLPDNTPSGPLRVSTVGGTSAAFGLRLTGISATATSGAPASAASASAVIGQTIQINGVLLDLTTDVIFQTIDSNGVTSQQVVRPLSVNAAGTQAQVRVPATAVSGVVRLAGDLDGASIALHIVPTVTRVDVQSVSADGSSAVVILYGSGFVEGALSQYVFGSGSGATVVTDSGPSIGPDVQQFYDTATSQYINGAVTMTVPLSAGAIGPITVRTSGGASAAFSAGMQAVVATAASGTPANATLASANAGQTIKITGTGLSTDSDILLRYIDYNGVPSMLKISPLSALADGSEASIVVPTEANGVFALQMFGASATPLLQIVPTVESFNESGVLYGSGFVEGASRYDFPSASVSDSDITRGVDVGYFYDPVRGYRWNGQATFSTDILPHHGAGQMSVTTAGGTSAVLALNSTRVGSASAATGVLGDVAVDRSTGAVWTVDQANPGSLLRIDPASGLVLQTITLAAAFGNQYTANYVGLQIAPQSFSLGGTAVPAGSLLLFAGYPYNGNNNIAAINPQTGALIKSLVLPATYYMTAGLFDPASAHLFVLSHQFNQMVEINPANGAEIARFTLPLSVQSYAGIAIDPVDGSFWIGTYGGGAALVKISRSGVELRRIDLSAQGVSSNEISGLAFAADGTLMVSSTKGALYRVSIA